MSLLRVLVLAVVFVAGTWFVGWYAVPVAAALYALLLRTDSAPAEATVAAVFAWGVLLARVSLKPAFSTLLNRLTALFQAAHVSGALVAIFTVLLAAALAWSAARVVIGLLGLLTRRGRPRRSTPGEGVQAVQGV